MEPTTLFAPVIAQVFLTFVVLLTLAITRVGTMQRRRIHPQSIATSAGFDAALGHLEHISENLENLFEMPVLFYAAAIVIFLTGHVDTIFVRACWAYVFFRALHSMIHCTVNRVTPRFYAFLLSNVVLVFIWIRLAILIV